MFFFSFVLQEVLPFSSQVPNGVADRLWCCLFFPPYCLAQLRTKTLRPAPAFALLSTEPPRQFRWLLLAKLAEQRMKFLRSPIESTHWVWEQPPLASRCPGKRAEREKHMNLNQLTIIGFIG